MCLYLEAGRKLAPSPNWQFQLRYFDAVLSEQLKACRIVPRHKIGLHLGLFPENFKDVPFTLGKTLKIRIQLTHILKKYGLGVLNVNVILCAKRLLCLKDSLTIVRR